MDPKYQILSKSLGAVLKHGHDRRPEPTSILGVYVKFILGYVKFIMLSSF